MKCGESIEVKIREPLMRNFDFVDNDGLYDPRTVPPLLWTPISAEPCCLKGAQLTRLHLNAQCFAGAGYVDFPKCQPIGDFPAVFAGNTAVAEHFPDCVSEFGRYALHCMDNPFPRGISKEPQLATGDTRFQQIDGQTDLPRWY